MIRSGAQMNAPSRIFLSTSDLVSTFSRFPDAPAGLHLRVAGHREVGPLLPRGLRVARRRIAHGQRDVPRGQGLPGAGAEAGLPLVEEGAGCLALGGVHGLVPVIAPAVALP